MVTAATPEFQPMLPIIVTTRAGDHILFASDAGGALLKTFFGRCTTLPFTVRI